MPDVVIVGGGIIGCACAYELARRGVSVALLERSELAAGASGRNQGLYTTPLDPALAQMARVSLAAYLELAEETPTPVMLDLEPCGWLALAGDDEEAALAREEAEAAAALGVAGEHLDAQAVHELEPELAQGLEGWLLHDGYRLDPAALTIALAHLASNHGATVRHHLPARRLIVRSDRVTGVLTDDGVVDADTVVVAAGPWTPGLLETLDLHLPLFGLRGWLVRLRPAAPLFSRILETAGRVLHHEPTRPPSAAEVTQGTPPADVGGLLHPMPGGAVLAGSSTEDAFAPGPTDASVPGAIARAAVRLVPRLVDAAVESAWWGVRPVTPDWRPIVGEPAPGIIVATGHASWGVILGVGTGQLVASIVLREAPPFDPSPFDPRRFD